MTELNMWTSDPTLARLMNQLFRAIQAGDFVGADFIGTRIRARMVLLGLDG